MSFRISSVPDGPSAKFLVENSVLLVSLLIMCFYIVVLVCYLTLDYRDMEMDIFVQ